MGSDFTVEGYNDKSKPCPEVECNGMVDPTWNANIGRCDNCGKRYSWESLLYATERTA